MTPKGAAERKRKWGGARLAAVAGVEATAWPVSGGGPAAGPALAAVPAVGLRPAGWPTSAGVCQRFLWVSTGLRAWGAGRAESGPGHARSARREPWSCGPRPRTVPRLVPPESPSPPAGNLGSRLIIQDVWEQNSVAVYSREQRASFVLAGPGDRSSPVFTNPSQHVRFFGRQLQYSFRKPLP